MYLATDLNPDACQITLETSFINQVSLKRTRTILKTIVHSVRTCFANGLRLKPRMVFFNPPYVESSREELYSKNLLDRSFAGGERGREVIDELIRNLSKWLDVDGGGVLYLLLIKQNDPEGVCALMSMLYPKVISQCVFKKRSLIEEIFVYKFVFPQ